MYWLWKILLITFAISSNSSEANKHQKKLSAVVVGTVYCETCFQQDIHKVTHFIAGAYVAIECKDNKTTSNPRSFRQQVKTDIHGQFRVNLPFHVSKHLRRINGCSIKLITSNQPRCSVAATASSSSDLRLKSRKRGKLIFSAGFLTFKPLKQPTICDRKPSITNNNDNIKKLNTEPLSEPPALGRKSKKAPDDELSDLDAVNRPDVFEFPPNPFQPPSIFPPNPFQPPRSLIPPLFPTPPPSSFPPLFPSPSPPPFFHLPPIPPLFQLPPIPGLTPASPPPPPPAFFIPLPPFPFQPIPGFPGVPSAEVSSTTKTSFP